MKPKQFNSDEFARRVLAWFDAHGRKQLPWQENSTPYRVWVSEIMLQQTQVATVILYYQRFMARFPTIPALAAAELDEVLRLWAGLGYYARARHLHQAAHLITVQHGGEMPLDLAALQGLPGIGRSTAGAILALSAGQRQPILDGNVKRVLARFAAVEGWPGQSQPLAALWRLAEQHTPAERVADYTQAMMDLGALVCVPRRPCCAICPLAEGCIAHAQGRETTYPMPKPRRELPVRTTQMLLLRTATGEVLLERRPPIGIWGGLWSFPEFADSVQLHTWLQENVTRTALAAQVLPTLTHTFSHYRLHLQPLLVDLDTTPSRIMEGSGWLWYKAGSELAGGLSAAVRSHFQH